MYFTADDEANALIARDPLALLIGFVLDQQVTVQKAFAAPLELEAAPRRSLDAAAIAGMDPGELERVFAERPALHRFPGAMARRVQELCAALVSEYDGRAERVWEDAADGRDLKQRLLALPGIGDDEGAVDRWRCSASASASARPAGRRSRRSTRRSATSTLPQALDEYQAAKRAYKAKLRAEAG